MKASKERIRTIIETMATFNDTPGNGITRFSYGETDAKAREYLIGLCHEMGLKVRVDSVGNIFARLAGSDERLPVVMSGSHIDSVKNGGRFDGIVGVAAALEAVRVMAENGYRPRHSIDIVMFSEEEGSNFRGPAMGSEILVGRLGISDLKFIKNAKGETAFDVIKAAGFDPEGVPADIIKRGDVKAMIELHIEQSVRLEMEGHQLGIVAGIAGLKWIEIKLTGRSNHAGATPMNLRQDPMAAAAQIISEVKFMARASGDSTVATVGKIEVIPNIPNAIPAEVTFVVDIRDVAQAGIDAVVDQVKLAVAKYAGENQVDYAISEMASTEAIQIKPYIIEIMKRQAEQLKLDYILMPSGAVHDSNNMAEVTDVGMIFVPSKDGRSHVKEEYTDWDDIAAGADLLLATFMELSK